MKQKEEHPRNPSMKKDPICNMDVNEEEAVTLECDGLLFYFCSKGCKEKFLKEKAMPWT